MTIRHLEAESVPPVCGHPEQIEQVVLNLCLNARDAMADSRHPAPSLTIEVDVQTVHGDTAGNTGRSGDFVRARITDQGVGMDEETQRRAFEPFFTTKEIGKGTGLGPSTAYGIAEQHGGWIDCESKPGKGSTFSVFLPVSMEESVQSAPPPTEQPPPRTTGPVTETILLVEDGDTLRRTITLMLRRVGYKVLESSNGKEGLEVLSREPSAIDLILLDLSMPMMSGEEVLEELRTRNHDIPVILLTGHEPEPELIDQVQAVIMKPVAFKPLRDQIRSAIDQR